MKSLSYEEALTNLAPPYHEDFKKFISINLLKDEIIFFACNQSYGRKLGAYSERNIGYFIVTSHRTITVDFLVDEGLLSGYKRKVVKVNKELFAFEPPNTPLTNYEKENRRVSEYFIKSINTISRDELKIDYRGEERTILKIGEMFFLNLQEGNEVYKIISELKQQNDSPPLPKPNIADQLEKLAELHLYQKITNEEYETFKKRLLGN